ncbi:MAG: hypothetical protein R2802_01890 [Flavobacteriaceae bacterium]|nr:hypothetical protein [Mangrovimonas sp.]MCB0469769.1 hypothetical protein [Flavobacteriaceae bacterium]MCB0426141.1 hypothetical protein [Mangrovimonas sp.]MCB0431999.1 hypothetical protein [Mangrovimonas sp.]MCB0434902.1 hypothetical protein [Mangrovimonas sp.]
MKKPSLKGSLETVPSRDIYLNIKQLEKGVYNLIIVDEHKIVKKIHVEKK